MPPDAIATKQSTAARSTVVQLQDNHEPSDSLFERVAWLYAFCRERVFRDDTNRIISILWPTGAPPTGATLVELGCGPGFYSCRLAGVFPQLQVTGVDRSERQLCWARQRAVEAAIDNCAFQRVNALMTPYHEATFDFLLASRLLTIISDAPRTVAEMHRVVKPGGRCLVAEPRYAFWASMPLFAMWLLASATHSQNGCREPYKATVYSAEEFANLFKTQPWAEVKTWRDGRYQYALCQKA